jgi:Mg2+ and Co2+ transporters
MIVLDYSNAREYTQSIFPAICADSPALFALCRPDDMQHLHSILALDESTVLDCIDIDESVRFTAFDGYDFASLVHLDIEHDRVAFSELNLYISRKFFVLVMAEHNNPNLAALEEKMLAAARGYLDGKYASTDAAEHFNQLFFLFFNTLISYFSDTLEALEDRMQALSEKMTRRVEDEDFEAIQTLRETAYFVKKVLRSFSYMGLQILCNENDVLSKKKLFLFRNLDTRFRKLYDFSENVYGLSTELLQTYDSKISQRTNDVINKLTFVTLFFGPLTVITGIYGMNFRIMPELNWSMGYPLALLVMAGISVGIYMIMKKKRWL